MVWHDTYKDEQPGGDQEDGARVSGRIFFLRPGGVLLRGVRSWAWAGDWGGGWGSKPTIEVSVEPSNLMSGCPTLPGGCVCAVDVDCAASAESQSGVGCGFHLLGLVSARGRHAPRCWRRSWSHRITRETWQPSGSGSLPVTLMSFPCLRQRRLCLGQPEGHLHSAV